MLKRYLFSVAAAAVIIIASMFPMASDADAAFSYEDADFEKAAEKCIGEICKNSEDAYVLYLYDEDAGVSHKCMYGINKALISCDYAVNFVGQIGIKDTGDLENVLDNIASRSIEITHILTDAFYIADETKSFFEESSRNITTLFIPDIYSKSGL